MKIIALIFGAAAVLLGGLWLVQGLGIVHLKPVLCVAECEAIEGASPTWAAIGFLMVAAGGFAIFRSLKRRPPR